MNETSFYVAESISELYNIDMEEAKQIVIDSHFPELLDEIPDFIQHYDADYWAKQIMDAVAAK